MENPIAKIKRVKNTKNCGEICSLCTAFGSTLCIGAAAEVLLLTLCALAAAEEFLLTLCAFAATVALLLALCSLADAVEFLLSRRAWVAAHDCTPGFCDRLFVSEFNFLASLPYVNTVLCCIEISPNYLYYLCVSHFVTPCPGIFRLYFFFSKTRSFADFALAFSKSSSSAGRIGFLVITVPLLFLPHMHIGNSGGQMQGFCASRKQFFTILSSKE